MPADWNNPTLASLYQDMVDTLDERLDDAARLFANEAAGASNLPLNTIRWNPSASRLEQLTSLSPITWTALTVADASNLGGNPPSFYRNAANLNAGSIPDARVPLSAVTQHQGDFGDMGADRIRLSATDDVDLVSTLHALQIGPDASANLVMDANEIQARNNGAVEPLHIQREGGLLELGDAGATPIVFDPANAQITIGGNQVPYPYIGRVNSGSSPTITGGTNVSGWVVSRLGTGSYSINHGLGQELRVILTPKDLFNAITIGSDGDANAFDVRTFDANGGGVDRDFDFIAYPP